ncbi:uncharacterized protein LOC116347980 [Contarinia nasturtii]|uniref:uncharacterized protein LOC116347980 n=1 Tax=Contarinia nasturtii TaxID=265458 RepID=UPI0012D483F0|nr:uncharacterized protein LOC116347980 [Contarinia nasturtii]
MPPTKKFHVGKNTLKARKVKTKRVKETPYTRKHRLESVRLQMCESRANETPYNRENRLESVRLRMCEIRANKTVDNRKVRLEADRLRKSELRAAETSVQREVRLKLNRERAVASRKSVWTNLNNEAFKYDKQIDYSLHPNVSIGKMDSLCLHCHALKFHKESPGMCCSNGKVVLPPLNDPPEPLRTFVSGTDPLSRHFQQNIRKYNSCFQMTSFGASEIVGANGYMPTFKVQGQVYHTIGSLLPVPEEESKFLQIYFMGDYEKEIDQRCAVIKGMKREIVAHLQALFHEHNHLIQSFKVAMEQMPLNNCKVIIRADKAPTGEHERRFNVPTIDEVAVVIVGTEFEKRDIVIQKRDSSLQRVAETHRWYDALQYPLLFWQGEDGYHFQIKRIDPNTGKPDQNNKKVSCMDFYAYRMMLRANQTTHILQCRQLFNQFIVDMYAKMESERLLFIRLNQKKLRVEEYIHLRDSIANDGNVGDIGKLVILPSTYIGSPRHMQEYTQDGLTYCQKKGKPGLFITFTCNPKWSEIQELLLPGQSPADRHDIIVRVFKQKLTKLMDVIIKCKIFGEVTCWMYTIEWQKRGLPHAHILIWLKNQLSPIQIDDIISAEIPDPKEDPKLFEIVCRHMIHGPCGSLNVHSPCMKDGKCTKRYPREMIQETQTGNDGYPLYRRRKPNDGGHKTLIKMRSVDVEIDNSWVVPYSPLLSKMFNAHINIECCNSVKSIKYICKYINKGSDMAIFGLSSENRSNDEITQFQMGRYISSNEAVWRILGFNIHERYPAVMHLAVHLENGQRVYFTEQNARERANHPQNTTLTAFFQLCQNDAFARTLHYPEVPKYYTWDMTQKQFFRRKNGRYVADYAGIRETDTIGRVYTVHPNYAECYYLRILLHEVRGPTSFQALKTINGVEYQTYREVCLELGLLENDQHWDTTLTEASLSSHPKQIRMLFAIILTTCAPSDPKGLWEKHKESISEDILRQARRANPDLAIQFSEEMFNEALILLEDVCMSINNKSLCQLGLPSPTRNTNNIYDHDLLREKQYDVVKLRTYVEAKKRLLTEDQKHAYTTILQQVERDNGGIFFLDAPGGTGKTFLLNLLLAEIRSRNEIAVAVASSGIAATLLEGGRTAHSAFKLPLNLNQAETPTCNIGKRSGMSASLKITTIVIFITLRHSNGISTGMATILKTSKIIIWDECTMIHKKGLEALDRTLRDLRGNDQIMENALILLSGDFRQTLPVIPRSTPADEVNACLKASHLWRYVKKIQLTTNMRVHLLKDASAAVFAQQLLDMGDGKFPVDTKTQEIKFPPNFCQLEPTLKDIENRVFPNVSINYRNHDWLYERAILAPRNENVNKINHQVQLHLPGAVMKFKSIDTVVDENQAVNYPIEFLNSLEPPGMPPHILTLKVGSPIMLIRNLHPPKLCNGTRLAIKKLMPHLIEATIIGDKYKGEDVLIPRIPMITTDLSLEFKRLQFPVRLAFAITINKAQGQTLKTVGLNLENPCFAHGQLFVGCGRVGSPKNLFIYTPNNKTRNIVYPLALQ